MKQIKISSMKAYILMSTFITTTCFHGNLFAQTQTSPDSQLVLISEPKQETQADLIQTYENARIVLASKPAENKPGVIRLYPIDDQYCLSCFLELTFLGKTDPEKKNTILDQLDSLEEGQAVYGDVDYTAEKKLRFIKFY